MASAKRGTLLIGIDFGTTFTGVSWLLCKEKALPGQPEVVTRWPSNLSRNSDRQKVPSKIHYNPTTGEISWGYNIPTDVEPIEWFKLLLLEPEDLQDHLRSSYHIRVARCMVQGLGKGAVEVVGDYLGVLWKHIMGEIQTEKGRNLILGTPIHVVLTVPAIWKDYARERMRHASDRAGILNSRTAGETTLSFISEPEAAALATIPDLDDRGDLEVDDSFVVVDAGGGTVDVISYKVKSLEPLVVTECVEGDGALCGATFLDERFVSSMIKSIGFGEWKCMGKTDIKKLVNNEWEHGIKCDFNGSSRPWTVDLPNGTRRGQVTLSAEDVRQIFNSVLPQIHTLVGGQLQAVVEKTQKYPKFVILVGGFGRCPFIFKSLEQRLGSITEVLQGRGERPWSSICRGATLSGAMGRGLTRQAVQVRTRIARMNYGWDFIEPYIEGVHNQRDKIWDELRGCWMADNQMEWVIRRGQDISTEEAKSYIYDESFSLKQTGYQPCALQIYTCTEMVPRCRVDERVQKLAEFSFSTPVPVEQLPKRKTNGPEHYKFEYDINMKVSGAALELSIMAGNTEIAAKSISVTYD
ncbi:hypothetical protein F5B20DRAFT_590217 [Whalleya microplaca]|nr:hypothetical protein F5B20DRAFT_590217 [Whalleya microplaca]